MRSNDDGDPLLASGDLSSSSSKRAVGSPLKKSLSHGKRSRSLGRSAGKKMVKKKSSESKSSGLKGEMFRPPEEGDSSQPSPRRHRRRGSTSNATRSKHSSDRRDSKKPKGRKYETMRRSRPSSSSSPSTSHGPPKPHHRHSSKMLPLRLEGHSKSHSGPLERKFGHTSFDGGKGSSKLSSKDSSHARKSSKGSNRYASDDPRKLLSHAESHGNLHRRGSRPSSSRDGGRKREGSRPSRRKHHRRSSLRTTAIGTSDTDCSASPDATRPPKKKLSSIVSKPAPSKDGSESSEDPFWEKDEEEHADDEPQVNAQELASALVMIRSLEKSESDDDSEKDEGSDASNTRQDATGVDTSHKPEPSQPKEGEDEPKTKLDLPTTPVSSLLGFTSQLLSSESTATAKSLGALELDDDFIYGVLDNVLGKSSPDPQELAERRSSSPRNMPGLAIKRQRSLSNPTMMVSEATPHTHRRSSVEMSIPSQLIVTADKNSSEATASGTEEEKAMEDTAPTPPMEENSPPWTASRGGPLESDVSSPHAMELPPCVGPPVVLHHSAMLHSLHEREAYGEREAQLIASPPLLVKTIYGRFFVMIQSDAHWTHRLLCPHAPPASHDSKPVFLWSLRTSHGDAIEPCSDGSPHVARRVTGKQSSSGSLHESDSKGNSSSVGKDEEDLTGSIRVAIERVDGGGEGKEKKNAGNTGHDKAEDVLETDGKTSDAESQLKTSSKGRQTQLRRWSSSSDMPNDRHDQDGDELEDSAKALRPVTSSEIRNYKEKARLAYEEEMRCEKEDANLNKHQQRHHEEEGGSSHTSSSSSLMGIPLGSKKSSSVILPRARQRSGSSHARKRTGQKPRRNTSKSPVLPRTPRRSSRSKGNSSLHKKKMAERRSSRSTHREGAGRRSRTPTIKETQQRQYDLFVIYTDTSGHMCSIRVPKSYEWSKSDVVDITKQTGAPIAASPLSAWGATPPTHSSMLHPPTPFDSAVPHITYVDAMGKVHMVCLDPSAIEGADADEGEDDAPLTHHHWAWTDLSASSAHATGPSHNTSSASAASSNRLCPPPHSSSSSSSGIHRSPRRRRRSSSKKRRSSSRHTSRSRSRSRTHADDGEGVADAPQKSPRSKMKALSRMGGKGPLLERSNTAGSAPTTPKAWKTAKASKKKKSATRIMAVPVRRRTSTISLNSEGSLRTIRAQGVVRMEEFTNKWDLLWNEGLEEGQESGGVSLNDLPVEYFSSERLEAAENEKCVSGGESLELEGNKKEKEEEDEEQKEEEEEKEEVEDKEEFEDKEMKEQKEEEDEEDKKEEVPKDDEKDHPLEEEQRIACDEETHEDGTHVPRDGVDDANAAAAHPPSSSSITASQGDAMDESVCEGDETSLRLRVQRRDAVRKSIVLLQACVRRHQVQRQKKLFNVAQEILQTEKNYVDALGTLLECFLVPFQDSKVLNVEELSIVFGNLEILRARHEKWLNSKDGLLYFSDWDELKRRGISDAFSGQLDFLLDYKTYINNYTRAQALVQNLLSTRKAFLKANRQCERDPRCHNHDLSSFLIQPIQRIPRYRMLLEDARKHTRNPTERAHLRAALKRIQGYADYLNGERRRRDIKDEMEGLDSILVFKKDQKKALGLAEGDSLGSRNTERRLIYEGDVNMLNTGLLRREGGKSRRLFLLSDIMIVAKPRSSSGNDGSTPEDGQVVPALISATRPIGTSYTVTDVEYFGDTCEVAREGPLAKVPGMFQFSVTTYKKKLFFGTSAADVDIWLEKFQSTLVVQAEERTRRAKEEKQQAQAHLSRFLQRRQSVTEQQLIHDPARLAAILADAASKNS